MWLAEFHYWKRETLRNLFRTELIGPICISTHATVMGIRSAGIGLEEELNQSFCPNRLMRAMTG